MPKLVEEPERGQEALLKTKPAFLVGREEAMGRKVDMRRKLRESWGFKDEELDHLQSWEMEALLLECEEGVVDMGEEDE